MAQPQQMEVDFGGRLDYLTNEMCQMNTWVGPIAHRQARIGSFAPSPSLSLEAADKDDDVGNDKDDASFSSDDEMTASQWLALCHSWEKWGVVLGLRVVLYLGGELV